MLDFSDKKIALCLSGQPRFLDDGYSQIKKHIFDFYHVDVFIHTWWDNEYIGKKFDLSPSLTYNRTCRWEENTIEKIETYYKPKKFIYEPQQNFNIFNDVDYGKMKPLSTHSMFYSIKKSNDLKIDYEKENNFIYDIVIRCRFDIFFNSFNIDLFKIDTELIYVSGEINRGGVLNVPNDQFAISSSKNMDYYSNLFEKFLHYRDSGYKNFVGESILKHHLIDVGNKNIYFCDEHEMYNTIVIK